MFRRICGTDEGPSGTIEFDGREIPFIAGDSVAATLLAAGVDSFRAHPVDDCARAPYCMMGVCFECLVEIDGRQNIQSCLVSARSGMVVRRQGGARTVTAARYE